MIKKEKKEGTIHFETKYLLPFDVEVVKHLNKGFKGYPSFIWTLKRVGEYRKLTFNLSYAGARLW